MFCHYGPFFALLPPYGPRKSKFWKNEKKNTWKYYHFTNVYHKRQLYDVWFLRYGVQQTEFFVIMDHFLPFYPPMDLENQNFGKMNNIPENIIILQMCNIHDSHMMCGSWDMKCNRQNFLSFWAIFCPFSPVTAWKIKILEKWKKFLQILSFSSVPKISIICYTVPEIWCMKYVIIFHFGPLFALLPLAPLTAWKIKT